MEALETTDVPIGTGEDTPMRDAMRDDAAEPANQLAAGTNDEAAPTISMESNAHLATRSSSASPSSYTPQFSATQSLILSRIKQNALLLVSPPATTSPTLSAPQQDHGEQPHGPASVNETTPRLGETLAMPTPSGERTLSAAARIDAANSYRLGLKRKRDHKEVDFSQSTISFPVAAPKPAPARWDIPSRVKHAAVNRAQMDGDKDMRHVDELEKLRSTNLAALPHGVLPAKAELVGFPAGQASDTALTDYFYGKRRTDLLNILSFADQLRPQLLVDVLVSVSKKHPDLPIFDSPSWNAETPPGTTTAPLNLKLTQRQNPHQHQHHIHRRPPPHKPRHGHVILLPDAKSRTNKHNKPTTSRKPLKLAPLSASADETPPTPSLLDADADGNGNDEDEVRDSLLPTWPKAGEGLYAKLTAEDQDRTLLVDENDEEAFSQFAVDRYGKQMALLLPACG